MTRIVSRTEEVRGSSPLTSHPPGPAGASWDHLRAIGMAFAIFLVLIARRGGEHPAAEVLVPKPAASSPTRSTARSAHTSGRSTSSRSRTARPKEGAWIECPLCNCRVFWYADEAIKGSG